MVRLRKWFLAVCVFQAFPQILEANAPLVAVAAFTGFSFMSALRTFGLSLVVVIFIEALVLQKREQLHFPEAFKLAAFANGLSTLIGCLVGMTYSSSFAMLPGFPLGVWWSVSMARSFLRNTGYLQQHPRLRYIASSPVLAVVFLLISIAGCYAGVSLLQGGPDHLSRIQRQFSGASEVRVTIALVAFLLSAGFILTVISEGYVIARRISSKRPQLVATVVLMNLFSYVLLFGTLGVSSSYMRDALYPPPAYEQPIEIAKASVAFSEKTFGVDHPNVATALMNLAQRYRELWPHDPKQRALYERALMIRENAYASDHPSVSEVLEKYIEYLERTQPIQAKYRSKEETSLLESLREKLSRIRGKTDNSQDAGK